MLHAMFGMGGSEILVILVIALIFLGPDKLPEAAKTISKGIRDLKKQSRVLQQTIENDEHIGGAIRDLKSALRGDEIPVRPPIKKKPPKQIEEPKPEEAKAAEGEVATEGGVATEEQAKPALTLPPTAGERDPEAPVEDHAEELAAMIKPAAGTVAKDAPIANETEPKQKHG